jgi:hypothetical protein
MRERQCAGHFGGSRSTHPSRPHPWRASVHKGATVLPRAWLPPCAHPAGSGRRYRRFPWSFPARRRWWSGPRPSCRRFGLGSDVARPRRSNRRSAVSPGSRGRSCGHPSRRRPLRRAPPPRSRRSCGGRRGPCLPRSCHWSTRSTSTSARRASPPSRIARPAGCGTHRTGRKPASPRSPRCPPSPPNQSSSSSRRRSSHRSCGPHRRRRSSSRRTWPKVSSPRRRSCRRPLVGAGPTSASPAASGSARRYRVRSSCTRTSRRPLWTER